MARLTREQWQEARDIWETDVRDGFDWLASHLGNVVSRQAISKAAKQQGWIKRPGEVAQLRPKSCATNPKVAQPRQSKQKTVPAPKPEAAPEPEWEEVDEQPRRIHGNSMYLPAYDRQVFNLCLLGATDAEVADFFGVTERTINNWKDWYSTFFQSMRSGKIEADAQAASSLFKRATGYRYQEVKTKRAVPFGTEDPSAFVDADLPVIEVVTTEKEMPPDTSAAFLWLKNRRPKDWRDKIEVENTHKLDPEMLDRIKTEFVDRMAMARDRQRQVLIDRGLVDE